MSRNNQDNEELKVTPFELLLTFGCPVVVFLTGGTIFECIFFFFLMCLIITVLPAIVKLGRDAEREERTRKDLEELERFINENDKKKWIKIGAKQLCINFISIMRINGLAA